MATKTKYDFEIKQGDHLPTIRRVLTGGDEVQDLTDAASIRFLMRAKGSTVLAINQTAVFVDRAAGLAEYPWAPDDTATVGVYEAEFEVTWPGAKVETFPGDGYISLRIWDDLG